MLTPWRRRTEMFCSTRLASIPAEAEAREQVAGCPAATCSIGQRLRPRAEGLMRPTACSNPSRGLAEGGPEQHGPQQGMPGKMQ